MADTFQLGVDTFGDVTRRPTAAAPQAQVLRDVVEEAVLADQVGLDASASANITAPTSRSPRPEVVLAAIAGRTKRILLGSAVTVLSTDEPVRVFQRFSTLDAFRTAAPR